MEYNITNKNDILKPGMTKSYFKIILAGNFFKTFDTIKLDTTKREFLIITEPHRKWYKRLLESITFRCYKAPWQYKITI